MQMILFILMLIFSLEGFAQKDSSLSKGKISDLPLQINKKSIGECLYKLKSSLIDQDLQSLNNLRVTIERVYLLKPSLLFSRQIELQSSTQQKSLWIFQANLNSTPNQEIFNAKNLVLNTKGQFEERPVPAEYQSMNRFQLNKFAGFEGDNIKDEWVEHNKISTSQRIIFKSTNFKVQEIEYIDEQIKKKLTCRILEGKIPLCQCL